MLKKILDQSAEIIILLVYPLLEGQSFCQSRDLNLTT